LPSAFCLPPSSLRLYPCLLFAALFFTFAAAAPAGAVDRIRIAVSNPNMPNLTVAVAQQRGFFKDENIEAEIIRMNPNIAITALSTGDVDTASCLAVSAAEPSPAGRSGSSPATSTTGP
jgi:ABC-type nitrate/sulfonate/bicarbonate transport system substrate-binding protein